MTDAARIAVFSDFNGTITDRDMLAALLESYGHDALLARVTEERRRGLLSLRERIAREAGALKCSLAEADARLTTLVTIDPSFLSFHRQCVEKGIVLAIVSSGIEPLIERMLERHGVTLPIHANGVEPRSDGWRVQFRDATPEGNAKWLYVEEAARDGYRTVVIGDDESDYTMGLVGDIRFAKQGTPLERFLSDRRLPFSSFDTFDDVWERLAQERALARS